MPSLGTGTFVVGFVLETISGSICQWRDNAGTLHSTGATLPAGPGYASPNQTFTVDTQTFGTGSFSWMMDLVAGHSLVVLTGFEGGTYTVEAAPAGFQPTTNLKINGPMSPNLLASGDTVTFGFDAVTSTVHGPFSSSYSPIFLPNNTSWVEILTAEYQVTGTLVTTGAYPGENDQRQIFVTGNYEIDAWWWTIGTDTTGAPPSAGPKDPCGNTVTPQLKLTGSPTVPPTSPAGPWKLLDPSNPLTAQPTVVVTSVEPNHGPAVGGTPIVIRGSGFGIGATVNIGTSVVVVSATEITCVTIADPPGVALVVVTNTDGTHN